MVRTDRQLLEWRLAEARARIAVGDDPASVRSFLDRVLQRDMNDPEQGLLWQDGSPFCGLSDECSALYAMVSGQLNRGEG